MKFEVLKESTGYNVYVLPDEETDVLTGTALAGTVEAVKGRLQVSSGEAAEIKRRMDAGEDVLADYLEPVEGQPKAYQVKTRRHGISLSGHKKGTDIRQTLHMRKDDTLVEGPAQ